MSINYKYERNVFLLLVIFFALLGAIVADYGLLPVSAGVCFVLAFIMAIPCMFSWMVANEESDK